MAADGLLFTGARVVTMNPKVPRAEAVGVRDGKIAAVGPADEVRQAMGGGVEARDLGGGALLPGFIDAHHHYSMCAFDRGRPDLELPQGSSLDELLAIIERAVREGGEGWLRCTGYEPARLKERRAPRLEELDEVCPDRPLLLISFSFHESCLNSRGLAEMGWDADTPDPPRGRLVRRRGKLTGEVLEGASWLAEARCRGSLLERGEDAWLADCEAHGRELLECGITRVGDAAVPPIFERLYDRALADGRLPITVHRFPVSERSVVEPRIDGDPTGSRHDRAPIGPAKLLLDGGEHCALCFSVKGVLRAAAQVARNTLTGGGLAALRASTRTGRLRRGPDGLLHRGVLLWEEDELSSTVARAAERGFQVAQHAIGNEAIGRAVTAIDRSADRLVEQPGRPRIEHLLFLDAELASRIATVGAMAVVHPLWIRDIGDSAGSVPLPPPLRAVPLRTLRDAGVELAGASDYPAAHFDVLAAMKAAATRRTGAGEELYPEESIPVEETLRAYTVGAARSLGVENECGTLEVGKRADLVALSADPLESDPDRLDDIAVKGTWVAGRAAYSSA